METKFVVLVGEKPKGILATCELADQLHAAGVPRAIAATIIQTLKETPDCDCPTCTKAREEALAEARAENASRPDPARPAKKDDECCTCGVKDQCGHKDVTGPHPCGGHVSKCLDCGAPTAAVHGGPQLCEDCMSKRQHGSSDTTFTCEKCGKITPMIQKTRICGHDDGGWEETQEVCPDCAAKSKEGGVPKCVKCKTPVPGLIAGSMCFRCFMEEHIGSEAAKYIPCNPLDDIYGEVLIEAFSIINGDRQQSYGHPSVSFARHAEYWTTYLMGNGKLVQGAALSAKDVAMLLLLLKVSREQGKPARDNIVDIAGYAGLVDSLNNL